jgi:hypothetical protein
MFWNLNAQVKQSHICSSKLLPMHPINTSYTCSPIILIGLFDSGDNHDWLQRCVSPTAPDETRRVPSVATYPRLACPTISLEYSFQMVTLCFNDGGHADERLHVHKDVFTRHQRLATLLDPPCVEADGQHEVVLYQWSKQAWVPETSFAYRDGHRRLQPDRRLHYRQSV